MNIIEKIDNRLTEMRVPKDLDLTDDEQWKAWLKFTEKRSKDKAAFRARMNDKKFMNKLKIFLGMRTPTLE